MSSKHKIYFVFLFIMALLYIGAGINHFWHPKGYLKIMPPFLPAPELLNYTSGAIEIILGVCLFPIKTRKMAAWGIILLLIAIFPANIYMCIDWYKTGHEMAWISIVRLPLQLLLIWWAWLYTRK